MKSVIKRRKKAKHYEMVIRDIIDILKEYIIFLLMFVILLVFHVMRGSWGGHLGLFLDVFFYLWYWLGIGDMNFVCHSAMSLDVTGIKHQKSPCGKTRQILYM